MVVVANIINNEHPLLPVALITSGRPKRFRP